ncbi:hypothetical protein [Spiroplasma mirum]|uniref:hypothetical protein n=1 Tax=Spiroplasma mirum TaxID=2144 RepID=UPI00130DE2E3|nr:hypothetical protein [Spiroplasma atrichopogonis]
MQLNDNGTIKMEVSKIIESFAGIFLETSDHKLFISLITNDFKEIYVYQLNNA